MQLVTRLLLPSLETPQFFVRNWIESVLKNTVALSVRLIPLRQPKKRKKSLFESFLLLSVTFPLKFDAVLQLRLNNVKTVKTAKKQKRARRFFCVHYISSRQVLLERLHFKKNQ